jgi:hypothetical protein
VAPVDARRPQAEAEQIQACAERPYLRCVGTPFGNRRTRFVAIERLTP